MALGERVLSIICDSANNGNSVIISPLRGGGNKRLNNFLKLRAGHDQRRAGVMMAMKMKRMRMAELGMAGVLALLANVAWAQTPAGAAGAAGDPAAGRQKNSMCVGCHGIEGYKTAFPEVYNVPKIGGQHPAYIIKALQAYKSGERDHPSMKGVAASLSDKDMADLAAYYSAGPGKVAAK